MDKVKFPKLYCPFPSYVNQHAEAVDNHILEWVNKFNLVTNHEHFERLRKSKFGRLAARAYPDAPLEELKIVAVWNTWLFIRDDLCDESGLGKNPDLLSEVHDELLEVLKGRAPQEYDSALSHALFDIRKRLLLKASPAWMCRFINSVIEYFDSSLWEAQNRASGILPETGVYILMRPYTGGLYTDIDLIDIAEDIYLPLHVRKHEVVQRLALMANNVVCWSNDIISYAKESKHQDVHNLVATLLATQPNLQKAVDMAADLINTEVHAFIELENRLPFFSPEINRDLQRFVAVLRSWMRGNLDWAYESGRYKIESDVSEKENGEANAVTECS